MSLRDLYYRIVAEDKTGKASQAAAANIERVNRATRNAAAGIKASSNSMNGSVGSVMAGLNALKGIAAGDITQIDNLGAAFLRSSSKAKIFGGVLGVVGAGIAGFMAGKKLDSMFGISDRIAGALTGTRPEDVKGGKVTPEMRAAEAAIGAMVRTARRDEALSNAADGPAGNLQKAMIQSAFEIEDVKAKLAEAQKEVEEYQNKWNRSIDESRRMEADLAALREASASRIAAAEQRVAEARKDAADADLDMKDNISLGDLDAEAAVKLNRLKAVTGELENIDAAFAGLGDKRTKQRALAALAGGDNQVEALAKAQDAAGAIDQVTAIEQQKRDPEFRRQQRALEKARHNTEQKIKRAQERRAARRPLAKWEKELLAENAAAQQGANNKAAQRNYEREIEAIEKSKLGINLDKAARALEDMKEKHALLLQAEGN